MQRAGRAPALGAACGIGVWVLFRRFAAGEQRGGGSNPLAVVRTGAWGFARGDDQPARPGAAGGQANGPTDAHRWTPMGQGPPLRLGSPGAVVAISAER